MNKQILLVDDDPIFNEVTCRLLRTGGYDVRSAPDHRAALEILEGPDPIDLLMTDIVMPGRVNGVALARMASLRRSGIKVLFVTGYDLPGVSSEIQGTVLRKPVDDEVLLAEVGNLLSD